MLFYLHLDRDGVLYSAYECLNRQLACLSSMRVVLESDVQSLQKTYIHLTNNDKLPKI